MILGLALVPSKSFQDEVNAYRKRYDNHYAQIMPHITIKPQFEIDDHDFNLIKNEVKNRISSIKPVEVHVFNQFNTEDFYGTAEHPFVPHFTIAQSLTSQEFEDIYGQVKLAGVDHREIIEELSLLQYSEEEDKWTIIETFTLG